MGVIVAEARAIGHSFGLSVPGICAVHLLSMDKPSEKFFPPDRQPIGRVVGKREPPPVGTLPSARARAAMTANANYRTRAPKGIFFYESHDEMTRDRDRWAVDAIVARHAERG